MLYISQISAILLIMKTFVECFCANLHKVLKDLKIAPYQFESKLVTKQKDLHYQN